MTDARALRDDEPGTIDRRKLLKIGAWAAPALLVATAAPAHAASDESNEPPANTISKPGVKFYNFTIDGIGNVSGNTASGTSAHKGLIKGNFNLAYPYNPWGTNWDVPIPSQMLVTYALSVDGGAPFITETARVVTHNSAFQVNWSTPSLAPGVHTLTFTSTAIASPEVIDSNRFVVDPQLNVTVNVTVN